MATAAAPLIPVEAYLRLGDLESDAEYVDGEIQERNVGERDHSALTRKLLLLLSRPESEPLFVCFPELRVQVAESRFRVPDLCLLRSDAPYEKVVRTPPLLCIEILSPEDRMSRTISRVREFLAMGVPEVWIFDPESRSVGRYRAEGNRELREGILTVPGTAATVSIAEVFSALPASAPNP